MRFISLKLSSGRYFRSNLNWLSLPPNESWKETGLDLSLSALFRILDFSKENRRILASHTVIFSEELEAERKKSAAKTKKVMQKLEDDKQHSTLGDLDSLAALKQDLETKK